MAEEKDDIERYHEGSLSDKERHALEKKALDDPFLSEALEGIENIEAQKFGEDLHALKEKIKNGQRKSRFGPLRIAAGIFIILGAGWMIYFLNLSESRQLAEQELQDTGTAKQGPAGQLSDSADLITMAKPDERAKSSKPIATQPKTKTAGKTDGGEKLVSGSQTVPTSIIEKQPAEEADKVTQTEEKMQAKETLAANDLKADEITIAPTQPVQLSQAGAGNKKIARSLTNADKAEGFLKIQNISGNVMAEDGTPLPGVNVVVKDTEIGTTTDSKGNFNIPVQDKKQSLVFSFIGMQSTEVVPNDKTNLNIQLREDISQLSEVVVTGQSLNDSNQEPVIKMAAPVGGLKAYNKYLDDNLRYPAKALENKVKGKVTISFILGTTGSFSEFAVEKGLGYGCEEEVVRLIKEGPKWNPTTQDGIAIESEVKVKMKFDPEKAKK